MSSRVRLHTIVGLTVVIALASMLSGRSAFSAPSDRSHAATAPGKNGRIAYKGYLGGGTTTGAIFTIDANGKGARQITRPKPRTIDDQPDWSPDGSRIVFHRSGSPFAIYTVRPDGSDLTRLSPPCSYSGPDAVELHCEDGEGASFLPDGKRVVYTRVVGTRDAGGDVVIRKSIVVRDADGSNMRVVIPAGADCHAAHFAPSGARLVYVCTEGPTRNALFVANADGSDQRRITPWSLDAGDNPDWSPDGKSIVFRSHEGGGKQSQVFVIRPDGSRLRKLTRFKSGTIVLSYSFAPDGKWITFSKSGRGGEPDIFIMRTNGTALRQVTTTAAWDSAPDWGPAR